MFPGPPSSAAPQPFPVPTFLVLLPIPEPLCLLPCLPIYLMLLLFPFFPPYNTGQLRLVAFSLCPPPPDSCVTLCK